MRGTTGRWALRLAAVGLILAWLVLLRPPALGGSVSWVRVTGISMEPTLDDGDLAVVRARSSYRAGDVVAFRIPQGESAAGGLVIHRIVGGSATGRFVTRGDNKRGFDPWKPTEEDIVGTLWFTVPGGGRVLGRLREPATFGSLAAGLVVFALLAGGGRSAGAQRRTAGRRRPPGKTWRPRRRGCAWRSSAGSRRSRGRPWPR